VARLSLTPHGESRVRAGHPWVYRADVARLDGPWRPEDAVAVTDARGRVLGRGFYNPRPPIACRLLTAEDEPVDRAFVHRRLEAAWAYRQALAPDGDAGRVVFSEADRLPGLVLDRYGDIGVLQALTLGVERHADRLAELACEVTGVRAVYRRPDPAAGRIEGLTGQAGWLVGAADPAPTVAIREGPARFRVAIESGQKTGFYLDQRDNRLVIAARAAGREMLDAFSYTGAFAIQALLAGARRALAIDASAGALAAAAAQAADNGVADRLDAVVANVFDALRALEREERRFDLIVLDPPPFTRRRGAVDAALRGYKEITLRALRCLRPAGLLATFSCSHHVGPALFEEICRAAAGDVGRAVRVHATLTQARDHPVLLAVPETRYLSGLLLEALE
jgi:23S rRNA (cytosine1962-C5)-methyltransferase